MFFELERQILVARLDDPALGQDVDEIGDDVVEQPLIVRDDEMPRSAARMAFTPSATVLSASISRPESVSSRIASFGSSTAIWKISFRFFSPPEKPSLTGRFSKLRIHLQHLHLSLTDRRNSIASSSARRDACGFR